MYLISLNIISIIRFIIISKKVNYFSIRGIYFKVLSNFYYLYIIRSSSLATYHSIVND